MILRAIFCMSGIAAGWYMCRRRQWKQFFKTSGQTFAAQEFEIRKLIADIESGRREYESEELRDACLNLLQGWAGLCHFCSGPQEQLFRNREFEVLVRHVIVATRNLAQLCPDFDSEQLISALIQALPQKP